VSVCTSKKDASLISSATKLTEVVIYALNTCIEKLEIKKNICTARSKGETLKRLTDNIISEVDYMCALKDSVKFPFRGM
jgi:hypothetical protein